MGTANTKSTIVTNGDATPNDMTPAYISHGRLREQIGVVEVAAADDNDSVYRFCRVWSGWRISQVDYANDAITSGAAYELGVHQTAENGGAEVDADEFASSLDLTSAHAWTEVTWEASATQFSDCEKRLWERLGLTEDPNRWYDITMTGTTVGTAAGTIGVRVRYVDGT